MQPAVRTARESSEDHNSARRDRYCNLDVLQRTCFEIKNLHSVCILWAVSLAAGRPKSQARDRAERAGQLLCDTSQLIQVWYSMVQYMWYRAASARVRTDRSV